MKTVRGIDEYKGKKVVAFKVPFVKYGKNVFNEYRIEVDFLFYPTLVIYKSLRKPIFRKIRLLSFLVILLSPIFLTLTIPYIFLHCYVTGAKNFFKNKVFVDYVRFFNYCNLVFFIISVAIIFIK